MSYKLLFMIMIFSGNLLASDSERNEVNLNETIEEGQKLKEISQEITRKRNEIRKDAEERRAEFLRISNE